MRTLNCDATALPNATSTDFTRRSSARDAIAS
jgi:hypothetical protein